MTLKEVILLCQAFLSRARSQDFIFEGHRLQTMLSPEYRETLWGILYSMAKEFSATSNARTQKSWQFMTELVLRNARGQWLVHHPVLMQLVEFDFYNKKKCDYDKVCSSTDGCFMKGDVMHSLMWLFRLVSRNMQELAQECSSSRKQIVQRVRTIMSHLKRTIFDFEDQSLELAVSAPSRVRQVDFGSQIAEVRHHRTKSTQTDGRFKNKAWPATHSPSTTGVRLPCVGPAAPVRTHVQSALPAPIVWMPVQVPSLVMGGSHSALMLPTPCHIDHSFAAMPSLSNVWNGYPMAANRHTPSIEAERPVSVRQPHCPLSAPPGLYSTLGKSSGDVLVAPAGFCLQSGELQTAAPSSANDMLDAASSSASRSDWWG